MTPEPPRPVGASPKSTSTPTTARRKPLTEPADLLQLLGRMMASFVLFWLTILWIVKTSLTHDPKEFPRFLTLTITTAVLSLFVQRATLRLWKRLREEREAAEAALQQESEASPS